jgi:hypothetical protein
LGVFAFYFLVTLQPLVDFEELLDLAQVLIRQVLQGAYLRKARVVVRGGQDVVLLALGVCYVQGSDRAGPHHAAGERRIGGGYHYVLGVAAIGERGGHEAVVGRVADGTWQDSIAHDDPEIGLLLVVLVAAAHRDLYESVEQPRSVFSDGQGFKVGFHLVYRPPPELELLTLTYSVGLRPSPCAATSETFHALRQTRARERLGPSNGPSPEYQRLSLLVHVLQEHLYEEHALEMPRERVRENVSAQLKDFDGYNARPISGA